MNSKIQIIEEVSVAKLQVKIDEFLEGKSLNIKSCDVQYINMYGCPKVVATIVYGEVIK